ncbi:hypothetical protein HanXRQr2_Chr14g0623951 [Helianthus annuus]|uniref:Uncharacterized protein n=1 Tax=Helianthus annuus TaxID=4232 RepID=A0A9K3E5Z3_HELAN|nr:hypothetical protein HanXRQr2_Chr14g0623951 [Helianthus annuus]KAJ0838772.1 hypothetical protein HanPSC8_Chr14g0598761 [Helianthus annuus]
MSLRRAQIHRLCRRRYHHRARCNQHHHRLCSPSSTYAASVFRHSHNCHLIGATKISSPLRIATVTGHLAELPDDEDDSDVELLNLNDKVVV